VRITSIIIVVSEVCCVLFFLYTSSAAQPTITLVPSSSLIVPLNDDTVDVRIEHAENLFAVSIAISFDSTILRYRDVVRNSFLESNGNSIFLGITPKPVPPAAPNTIVIDQAILGGKTVSGSGSLCKLIFTALKTNVCALTIDSVDLRNGSNESVPVQIQNGIVTIDRPPVITSTPLCIAWTNRRYQYQVQGADPDSDRLHYALLAAPSFLSIDTVGGMISGIPDKKFIGAHTITAQVIDEKGESCQQSFQLSVLNSNHIPSAVQLLYPDDKSTLDTTMRVQLRWTSSSDSDAADHIHYIVHLRTPSSDICYTNISDTTFLLTEHVLQENSMYSWNIGSSDGIDTAWSPQLFTFQTPLQIHASENISGLILEQNYPNPFYETTTIEFFCSPEAQARVTIYDVRGRKIIVLNCSTDNQGRCSMQWNGRNEKGVTVQSGVYFYAVTSCSYSRTGKMLFLR